MRQKINIAIINSIGRKQFVKIFRENLGSYKKTKLKYDGRTVWGKAKNLKKLYSRAGIGVKKQKGVTEISGKKYVRYSFSLWRKKIESEFDLARLMILLKRRYNKVKNFNKTLIAQRIGVFVGTSDKIKKEYFYSATKRKRHKEVVDIISTATYERGKESEDPMFEELEQKIREVFFDKKGYSLDINENTILQALKFIVIFTQE